MRVTSTCVMVGDNDTNRHDAATGVLAAANAISEGEETGSSSPTTSRSSANGRGGSRRSKILDDARKLVREKRQKARERHAKATAAAGASPTAASPAVAASSAATDGGAAHGADGTAALIARQESDSSAVAAGKAALEAGLDVGVPASERTSVGHDSVAPTAPSQSSSPTPTAGAVASAERSPSKPLQKRLHSFVGQRSTMTRQKPFVRPERSEGGGGRGRGGNRTRPRKRALPDFVTDGVVVPDLASRPRSSPAPASSIGGSSDDAIGSDHVDNVALISAVKAALADTLAQLDKLNSNRRAEDVVVEVGQQGTAAVAGLEAGMRASAVLAGLPEYDKPQVEANSWILTRCIVLMGVGGGDGGLSLSIFTCPAAPPRP